MSEEDEWEKVKGFMQYELNPHLAEDAVLQCGEFFIRPGNDFCFIYKGAVGFFNEEYVANGLRILAEELAKAERQRRREENNLFGDGGYYG